MIDPTTIAPILLAALTPAAAASPTAASPVEKTTPIALIAEEVPTGVVLRVVGDSAEPVDAAYSLEVANASGGNRSVQSGRARLRPNERVVLLTAQFGGDAQTGWRAILRVTPTVGAAYEVKRQAPQDRRPG